jgi:hypothetical protein
LVDQLVLVSAVVNARQARLGKGAMTNDGLKIDPASG